jgi:hypothetical protein
LGETFAARRAKGLARLLKYLREQQRLGPAAARAERDSLADLLAHPVDDVRDARAELCAAIDAGRVDLRAVIPFCRARADGTTQIVGPAMGALADRHYAPIA